MSSGLGILTCGAVAACIIGACVRGNSPSSASGADITGAAGVVAIREVVHGLDSPVLLTAPAGDARLFVVEQPGRIRIVENGQIKRTSFLDITDRIASGGERGLLGLAFHPRYATNGFFYVNYTDRDGDTRVERYSVTSDRNVASATGTLVITIKQPYSNHNGGNVVFGPDGMLYIGMGDGGSGGDPQGNGQNTNALLGKILRVDVDHAQPYAIPADNPKASGMRPEVWAYGMRNPWRFSWDKTTGMLYTADVGQGSWEEVNVVPGTSAGLNYGWNVMEGSHCYRNPVCSKSNMVSPAVEYDHGNGCSVTGGFVYRGAAIPAVAGRYFYSDWCGGWLRSFRYVSGAATEKTLWPGIALGSVTSFGEDAAGELYVMNGGGFLYKLVAGAK